MKSKKFLFQFVVFEGIDGSGKSTQTKLLAKYLKSKGYRVATIDFPQYGKKSAGLVEEYLSGKYGSLSQVGPWRASMFYACDRYDGSFKIRNWLKQGKIVISDRYMASNIGHQGGKIEDKKERRKFLRWIYYLEYNIFKIPQPDTTFILNVAPAIAQKLSSHLTDKEKRAKKRLYLGKRKHDIHENNLVHLSRSRDSYLLAAHDFPQDFEVIECMENGELLPPEAILQKIIKILNKKKESRSRRSQPVRDKTP